MPGLTPASSEKSSGGLMRLFTRKTNKLQPKFEMTGELCRSFLAMCVTWHPSGRDVTACAPGPTSHSRHAIRISQHSARRQLCPPSLFCTDVAGS